MKKIDFFKESLKVHKKNKGKLTTNLKVKINNKNDLSIAYSPGVAKPCLEIVKNPKVSKDLTFSKNVVAVISDGSAVLGLGNIGDLASLPVMEGKSALFKRFANIESIPIVINTQNPKEFIQTVKNIKNSFGAINLEDISAPRCFEIEETLKKELDIPVFHDDQHGTAIVVLAGIINCLKIKNLKKDKIKIVINGAGAAGTSILKLLNLYGVKDILICDRKGIISKSRKDLNKEKKELLKYSNSKNTSGCLISAMSGCDIFIGVSSKDILKKNHIDIMRNKIVFGLANPSPEISFENAKKFGVEIYSTGRSDYPNQINNVLAFPGIFKACFDKNIPQILDKHKLQAANAISNFVKKPSKSKIIPSPFDKGLVEFIVKSIKK